MRKLLDNWKRQNMIKKAADIVGILVILAGIGVSIGMNCAGRTL